jgi:hypothetical protein
LAPPAIAPVFIKPSAPLITAPVIPQSSLPLTSPLAAPDITGIGRSLFNCDLANNENLPREKRANCLNFGVPPVSGTVEAGLPKNSKTKHGAIWAAELATKQAPPVLPCVSIQQQVFGGLGVQKPVGAIMADPLCLLGGLLNGFHSQPK